MRLHEWAKQQGISYTTAWRWFKNNKLPVSATKTPSGTILIDEPKYTSKPENIVVYCRVSSQLKKDDLKRQVDRCLDFSSAKGFQISTVYKEIASGMNDNRKEFWKMINSEPTKIVVENKDRLTRFGFNYIDQLMKKLNCEIVVINPNTNDDKE
jgi:predicted site-specific integrase-resolvase